MPYFVYSFAISSISQLFFAIVRINHQSCAIGGDPDHILAQGEDFLHLRLLLQNLEVGVAHRLDLQRRCILLVLIINPDAVEFDAVATVCHARARWLCCDWFFMLLLREIDTELALLGLSEVVFVQLLLSFIVILK